MRFVHIVLISDGRRNLMADPVYGAICEYILMWHLLYIALDIISENKHLNQRVLREFPDIR